MASDFHRIMDGLRDALRIARCQHGRVISQHVSRRTYWFCEDCMGRFNADPRKAEEPTNGEA